VKRRKVKGKREKEKYTLLNAEFQRIARRDKKAFLSDQCKEIEENNRMGKTRDLFKKIRDTKAIFHAKMGSIKDRNGMDLIEAEDIKKRWQEYTEELYKKDLHNADNHNGVITHPEPDILEYEVKWALGVSKLKWTGMGEFNSDDHFIYHCGQESLRRNGVTIIVNKRFRNAVLGCNLRNDRMISVRFQGKASFPVCFYF